MQDYNTLLAQRWQGGAAGRITHWIVWNEADNSQWFDMSPEVNGEPGIALQALSSWRSLIILPRLSACLELSA